MAQIQIAERVLSELLSCECEGRSSAYQADAATTNIHSEGGPVIVTDPPYYDNIAYADLSDFFLYLAPPSTYSSIYPEFVIKYSHT